VAFADNVEQALVVLDQEIRRVLDWLEHDRPKYWKAQVHQAHEEEAQARSALHRCLMFPINNERPSCHEERAALKRAQARVAYCEEKSERLKYWIREVRRELFEYEGRISRLSRIVEVEVPQATGLLSKLLDRLEDYRAARTAAAVSAYSDVRLAADLFGQPSDARQPIEGGEVEEQN
jgi:hypothetical protein